jgi:hypothetical protein
MPAPSFALDLVIPNCVFNSECPDESLRIKRKLVAYTNITDEFEDPNDMAGINLEFTRLAGPDESKSFLGILSVARYSSLFILTPDNNRPGTYTIGKKVDAGVVAKLKIEDIDNDGDDDVTFINFPTGTNVQESPVILLNTNGNLEFAPSVK